jgi:poly-beta-1,6-N-acetyl-D-glucosamine synthase
MLNVQYIIITPARNEEEYIQRTIESVASQTVRPERWIIVDDGSTDRTGRIIDEAAKRHSWIIVVHRSDRGFRRAGGGVMEAFLEAYKLIVDEPWQFLVKLDGDLSFGSDYFEKCFEVFRQEPRLGIGGGTCCKLVRGKMVPEFVGEPTFHVRGPSKIYRRECFKAIGGLIKAPGWDTVDLIKANMLGWTTRTFSDIKLIHHRPTGEAYGSWSNWTKNGLANYVVGYHPLFMILKCVRRLFKRPYGLGAIGLMVGFWRGYLRQVPQVEDHEAICFLRKQQLNFLIGRKSLWNGESGKRVQVCV